MKPEDQAAFEAWWNDAPTILTDLPKKQAEYIWKAALAHRDAQASAINEQMLEALKSFEITGPDDDGLLWLVLDKKDSTCKAAFNLGEADNIFGQVALKMKDEIQAAIAAAESHKEPKC